MMIPRIQCGTKPAPRIYEWFLVLCILFLLALMSYMKPRYVSPADCPTVKCLQGRQ